MAWTISDGSQRSERGQKNRREERRDFFSTDSNLKPLTLWGSFTITISDDM